MTSPDAGARGGNGAARRGAGLRLALTTLTVLPVRPGPVDRAAAAGAMRLAPAVGALVGLGSGAVLVAAAALTGAPLVAGGLAAGAAVLLTRGLHLDGLADTVDALGSYRRGAAGLAVMRQADIGPFGVAALVLTLLVQAAALAALAGRSPLGALAAAAAAGAAGRLAAGFACRRGLPAARSDGLGALVAGTVGPAALALGFLATAALAVPAVPGRWWQGPVAVAVALAAAVLLVRHAVRRFGGVTGDVLGAAVEVAVTVTLVGLLPR
ncbi:adenosylcobinamide-GDP ribazoletransferase [Pilimelia terevasa]|uniref:Adenosylcobinamide-GDP ribazoletransferase n=1 Tax=Pilimelia terevasa TaxID=53372 RepID=A0A8J3BQT8_9ACTN|nr:adenosylcobinamide-GDP ribazoletransferase [Pilimelia terevasa]GGK26770.1 adenosylcobinamide-GDP ribazoletransferase [Pilimelia terevasa]